jgi:hypothetical protein
MKIHIKRLKYLREKPPASRTKIHEYMQNELSEFKQSMEPYYKLQIRKYGHSKAEAWYSKNVLSVAQSIDEAFSHILRFEAFEAMRIMERNRVTVDGNACFENSYLALKHVVYYMDEYSDEYGYKWE